MKVINSIFSLINYKFSDEGKIHIKIFFIKKGSILSENDLEKLEFRFFYTFLEEKIHYFQEKYLTNWKVYFYF